MKIIHLLMALMVALFFTTSVTLASGGGDGDKIRDANPVRGDECLYQIPEGIDEQDCEEIVSADNSFPSILKCNAELIYINCEGDDNPSSDGNSNPNGDEDSQDPDT